MPVTSAAGVVAMVDKLQAIIKDIPREFISDVETAAMDLFQMRRQEIGHEAVGEAGEGDVDQPVKKRTLCARRASNNGLEELAALQAWLREKVPVEAVLPSEQLHYNPTGGFADHTSANTVSIDAFLWDEADVDELCDQECGSRKTAPLNFVSHSFSIAELNFAFTKAVPSAGGIEGRLVVDVGSRLGCVVYAALVLGGASESVGIEINKDLCVLQRQALQALGAGDKARVICGDVCDQEEVLGNARLVVLHNPFHFFQDLDAACAIWKKLAQSISPGTLLMASPPLREQLEQASSPPPVNLDDWVETIKIDYPHCEDPDDEHADENGLLYTSIELYRVLKKPDEAGGGNKRKPDEAGGGNKRKRSKK